MNNETKSLVNISNVKLTEWLSFVSQNKAFSLLSQLFKWTNYQIMECIVWMVQ